MCASAKAERTSLNQVPPVKFRQTPGGIVPIYPQNGPDFRRGHAGMQPDRLQNSLHQVPEPSGSPMSLAGNK